MKTELSFQDKNLLAYIFSLAGLRLDEIIEDWQKTNEKGEFDKLIEEFKTTKKNADKLFFRLFNNKE